MAGFRAWLAGLTKESDTLLLSYVELEMQILCFTAIT